MLRALRKAPEDRYASAAALADDVGRYLAGRPVEAREPSLGYVVRRLAVRHKAAFMSSASALLVIVALLVVSVWQARVARTERDRADARFQDVRRLANSVIYELHDAIANLPGATPARRLLVARALEYPDRLAAEARGDVALKRELAGAYQKIAQVQNSGLGANLGDTRTALESYGKALTIRKALAARTPVESQDVFGLALLEFDLGPCNESKGRPNAPSSRLSRRQPVSKELSATGALHDGERIRLAGIYQRLAEAQAFQGKSDAAIRSAEKAVAEADAALRARPQDRAARSVLAAASYQLSESFAGRDRYQEAIEWTVRARTVLEAALRETTRSSRRRRASFFTP